MKRKIAVFTGNRAEYGLQYSLLKAICAHPHLELQLLVSGAHLDEDYGNTLHEIRENGFAITAEVSISTGQQNKLSTSVSIGKGIIEISSVLEKLRPDILVVYGDRFEAFAACIASTQMNIPTAHIEGGDITEGGALDDSVRHAITKLSHLHFTTNTEAYERVLRMGEEPWRTFMTGFPALDVISEKNYASPNEIQKKLSLNLTQPVVVYTQHSITTEPTEAAEQITQSIEALKVLSKEGIQIVITYPNNDVGGEIMIREIQKIDLDVHPNIQIYHSLGRYFYHGLLSLALDKDKRIVCAGNSSSGIKETAIFSCPVVNIGSRQEGRLRSSNVIDVDYDTVSIYNAIKTCLEDRSFRETCSNVENPYGVGGTGKAIADILFDEPINKRLLRKKLTL